MSTRGVPKIIEARRSIRAFAGKAVEPEVIDTCIAAACRAPAPHHSRPWRFVRLDQDGLGRLAEAMAAAWRTDLQNDGVTSADIERLATRSRARIGGAPAGVLGCLVLDGLDRYPDERRQQIEWGMARLSLGAAIQNLLLTATAHDLASCWMAAPIFCPSAAIVALELPHDVHPEALVLLGYPDPTYRPPARPPVDVAEHRLVR